MQQNDALANVICSANTMAYLLMAYKNIMFNSRDSKKAHAYFSYIVLS